MEESTKQRFFRKGTFLILGIFFMFIYACQPIKRLPKDEKKELPEIQTRAIIKPVPEFSDIKLDPKVFKVNKNNRFRVKELARKNELELIALAVYLPFFSSSSLEVVEVKNGIGYIDGDIDLGPIENLILMDSLIRNGVSLTHGLSPSNNKLWKGGIIPYEIKTTDFVSTVAISSINQAIDSVNNLTNLTLLPRTTQDDYIKIERNFDASFVGSSPVGKCGSCFRPFKANHTVKLGDSVSVATVVHEFMHTAGVYHEQSRPDRDNFVTINFGCIQDGLERNFKKRDGTAFGPYDFRSIMHYPPNIFNTSPGCNTITRNDGLTGLSGNALSTQDIEGLVAMYNSNHGNDRNAYLMLLDKERDVREGHSIVDGNVRIIESPQMPNDEIYGLRVRNFPAGATIKVYDNKSTDNQNDFSEIIFKRAVQDIVIYDFEQNLDANPNFRIVYNTVAGSGNINGKVSRIEVDLSPPAITTVVNTLRPRIELREGNGGTQDFVGSITNFQQGNTYNFTQISTIDNDEARSMVLFDMPAGTVIRVFDNSNGNRLDDWAEIIVKRDISQKVIGSFERQHEDDDIRMVYFKEGNLDGKVSRLEISDTPTGPMLNLYSGGFDNGEIKAAISLTNNLDIDCKNNNIGISNDDISYMKLYNAKSGTRIFVFDHNDDRLTQNRKRDDWTVVRVTQDVKFKNIPTFEQTINTDTDGVIRLYNGGGNLDGKISFIQIRM